MSAQPADSGPLRPVVRIPRTIAGVRAALDADDRAEFQAELERTEIPQIADVVASWWSKAVVDASPVASAAFARLDAGTWEGVPIEQLIGAHGSTV